MKSSGKTVVCLLSALALSMGAKALISDQPNAAYHNIVDRNAFGLKPPPDPKTLTPPVIVDPLPKITLTGITTILGRKIVFLTVASKKSGVPPEALMLMEGQGQG